MISNAMITLSTRSLEERGYFSRQQIVGREEILPPIEDLRLLTENHGFRILGRVARRTREEAGEQVTEETGFLLARDQLKRQGAVILKAMKWTKASKNKIRKMYREEGQSTDSSGMLKPVQFVPALDTSLVPQPPSLPSSSSAQEISGPAVPFAAESDEEDNNDFQAALTTGSGERAGCDRWRGQRRMTCVENSQPNCLF